MEEDEENKKNNKKLPFSSRVPITIRKNRRQQLPCANVFFIQVSITSEEDENIEMKKLTI